MSYELSIAGSLIRVRFHGDVTKDDFLSAVQRVEEIERELPRVPDRLIDLSGAVRAALTFDLFMPYTSRRRVQVFPNAFRSAIVAPTPMAYGLARMFQTLNDNPQIELRIFQGLREAEDWLAAGADAEGSLTS